MAGLLDFIGNNAGSLLGGLFGAASSGDTKTGTTQSRDPWGPAQPHILRNLQNEADLQGYYQKTPFNAQQQQGYSNLFGDIGNFRDNVAPGLMDFANRGMATNYQRQRGSAPGSIGYGAQPTAPQAAPGPFSVARGAQPQQNTMMDLNGAQNPYTNGGIKATAQAAPAMAGGGLLGGFGGAPTGGNGGAQTDFNPGWTAMGDVEKANYYNDNPTMAGLTQALQMGFSLTDIGRMQGLVAPEVAERARQIARGDSFGGGGASFGGVNLGNPFAGMGPGDVNQLGVSLGNFGDADPSYGLTGLVGEGSGVFGNSANHSVSGGW